MIGAATAIALENARRREEEEAAQKAAAEANAAAFNAVEAVIDEQQRQIKVFEWLQEKAEETRKATALAIQQSLNNQKKHLFSEPDETINNDSELLKAEKLLDQTISGERPWETLNLQQSLTTPKTTDVCYVDPSKNPQTTIISKATLTDPVNIAIPIITSEISNTVKPNTDTWWGKTINWVDNHQVLTAIGIGILAGVIVIATAGWAAPGIAVLIGMGAAAGVSAGGTLALNAFYQRDLTQNLVRNTILSGSTAFLTVAAPSLAITTFSDFTILSYALTSTVEETNFFYGELQAIKTVAPAAIGALTTLATLAGLGGFNYAVSEVVDPTISKDEKERAIEVGNVSAAAALSGMMVTQMADSIAKSFTQLPSDTKPINIKDSKEMELRANRAVKAIQEIVDLKPTSVEDLNSPKIQSLISTIAQNSVLQAGDGTVLVTGKEVDYYNGYRGYGNKNGALYYHTSGGVSKIISSLPGNLSDLVFEMINKKALDPLLQQGIPVVTTLDGIDKPKEIEQIQDAIGKINQGNFSDARSIFKGKNYPFMLREAEWIKGYGYTETYNPIEKIYYWVKGQ